MMTGKNTIDNPETAPSSDGARRRVIAALNVLATLLFIASLVMRATQQFYVVPFKLPAGYSVTGLKIDGQLDLPLLVLATFLFLAGTYGLKIAKHALLFQVGSLALMGLFDIKMMWYWLTYWNFDELLLWFNDFLTWQARYTLPAFRATVALEVAILVLCLVRFVLSVWKHPPRGGGRP